MQSIEDVIKIHQCLHGYADGHQLIHASTKIPPKADQLLLTLSDMSGSSMVSGFQSYLTGYPLTDTSWYAFAKTWYASEMSRPGCVWTHSLLIETADLARVQDFRSLLKLFVRPSKDRKQSSYSTPIKLDLKLKHNDNDRILSLHQRDVVLLVLTGLYEKPDMPVYLTAKGADQYTDLVLEIWNQQYPKLRRSFWFCTGSLANRKAAGRTFDLQVIPTTALRHTQREVPNGVFIESQSTKGLTDMPLWLYTASDDLLSPTEDDMRPFLLLFGADAPEGRGAFSQLLDLYTHIYQTRVDKLPLSELISVVNTYYPEAQQGTRLKQVLFGGTTAKPKFLPTFSETDLLRELAITIHYAAFDAETLKLRERAKNLVYHEPNKFKEIIIDLLNYEVNPLGEEIITGISEVVTPTDALELAAQRYSLLFVFTKYNPSLLTMPQIWQEPQDRQRELYDLVSPRIKSGELNIEDIIRAMLDAGSNVLAEEVVRLQAAVNTVLSWFDSSTTSKLDETWERALSYQPEAVLKWLSNAEQPRNETLALLVSLLDPHSERVIRFGTKVWLSLADVGGKEFDEQTHLRVMAFLLALSFNNPDVHAPELVAKAFQPVHDAAAREGLPYASWRLLMYQAPSLSWWGEWDKCERLRHALIEKFIKYGWNVEFFLQAVKNPNTFMQVLRTGNEKSSGRKFLRRITKKVDEGRLSVTEEQRIALSHYL